MKLFCLSLVFRNRRTFVRVFMAKFWITIALLFSLIAQSAMVSAMPTPAAMNDQNSTDCMQIIDGKVKCTMPISLSDECMQHCQDALTNHCQTHCLTQLYIGTAHPQLALMNHISMRIAIQGWTIQTADLDLATPPPNSYLL